MELHERFKHIRKNVLHLSQTECGERIGVSRSVINNIERNVLAKPEQKISLLKLFCKEFDLSEDYVLYGKGPIRTEAEYFSLDAFAKEHGATPLEIEILKTYFELDPAIRKSALQVFKSLYKPDEKSEEPTESYSSQMPTTPSDFEKEHPPLKEESKNSVG